MALQERRLSAPFLPTRYATQTRKQIPTPMSTTPTLSRPRKKLPTEGINFHSAVPTTAPALRIGDFVSGEERLIIMRALSAAADRWREHSRTEAFQSDDVDWAADAAIAESIYRQLAQ